MNKASRAAAAFVTLFLLGGCATLEPADTDRVAFGTFNLISNGHEITLGDGPAQRNASIHVRDTFRQHLYSGRVGDDGRFALSLPSGNYVIETIAFEHHGETIESPANFRFNVPDALSSVYIGAVTLEATLDSGIYGVIGTADRYTISNECSDGCERALNALGLPSAKSGVSLMSWDHQMASNR
ncbi:MAG: hypothetical protein AAGA33_08005 [Pseudomonadota bacterium]